MRKVAIIFVAVVALSLALPSEACERCHHYWSDQANRFCEECVSVYCGYMSCYLEQYQNWGDLCFEDHDCFEYEGLQYCGPDQQASKTEKLDDTWRLVQTRVYRPARSAAKDGHTG